MNQLLRRPNDWYITREELQRQLQPLIDGLVKLDAIYSALNRIEAKLEPAEKESDISLDDSIEVLQLNARAMNCLSGRVNTVGELIQFSRRDLIHIEDMGYGTIDFIEQCLERHGLKLHE